jgi:hypothetical protein
MLCDVCRGKGIVQTSAGPQPCEECGGSGIVHCCEGLQAQPELEPSDERDEQRGAATRRDDGPKKGKSA